MSPARAGSFNANFSPETLESFKSLCRDQSKQYTKVLERLAELYLGSQGQILDNLTEPQELELNKDSVDLEKLKQSVEQLETMTSIHQEDLFPRPRGTVISVTVLTRDSASMLRAIYRTSNGWALATWRTVCRKR